MFGGSGPTPGAVQPASRCRSLGQSTAEQDAHCQVLVDHDHKLQLAASVFGAAEQRIVCRHRVKCSLKIAHKVAFDQAGHELSPLFTNARVACPTPTPPLLDQLVTDAHPYQFGPRLRPQELLAAADRAMYRAKWADQIAMDGADGSARLGAE